MDWLSKPWPIKFDGPVFVCAPTQDPDKFFYGTAWWDGERLTLLPYVWGAAVTHIMVPEPPEPIEGEA